MERARALGADSVLDHTRQNLRDEVRKLTDKRGVDIVFEHVGAATWDASLACLAAGGRLVTCGATTGYEAKIDLRHLFARQLTLLGRTAQSITVDVTTISSRPSDRRRGGGGGWVQISGAASGGPAGWRTY
jgi:NADPH:quinone reductase-like Zn-dependent oxidoreductase